jgi:hypothetical protein
MSSRRLNHAGRFRREAVNGAIHTAPSDAPPALGEVQLQSILVTSFVPAGLGRPNSLQGDLAYLRLLGCRVQPDDWAIWFAALAEAIGQGHCGLPKEDLSALTTTLLEVEPPLVRTALELELEAGEVHPPPAGDQPQDRRLQAR